MSINDVLYREIYTHGIFPYLTLQEKIEVASVCKLWRAYMSAFFQQVLESRFTKAMGPFLRFTELTLKDCIPVFSKFDENTNLTKIAKMVVWKYEEIDKKSSLNRNIFDIDLQYDEECFTIDKDSVDIFCAEQQKLLIEDKTGQVSRGLQILKEISGLTYIAFTYNTFDDYSESASYSADESGDTKWEFWSSRQVSKEITEVQYFPIQFFNFEVIENQFVFQSKDNCKLFIHPTAYARLSCFAFQDAFVNCVACLGDTDAEHDPDFSVINKDYPVRVLTIEKVFEKLQCNLFTIQDKLYIRSIHALPKPKPT